MEFKKGSTYTRNEIHMLYFGKPVPKTGTGDWTTGYVRVKNELIIFMNINIPGTTGYFCTVIIDSLNCRGKINCVG